MRLVDNIVDNFVDNSSNRWTGTAADWETPVDTIGQPISLALR
jgi:hypothetical protein